jgi:hypothetical protein
VAEEYKRLLKQCDAVLDLPGEERMLRYAEKVLTLDRIWPRLSKVERAECEEYAAHLYQLRLVGT